MNFAVWQFIIMPLAIALLTTATHWLSNRHTARRQRNDRLCALLEAGKIQTVDPLVLKIALDEAYGVRVPLDPRAVRFALMRRFDGERVLRAYLSARDLVRFNSTDSIFEDGRKFARHFSGFREWSWISLVGGFALYFVFLAMTGLAIASEDLANMLLSLLAALISIPAGIAMSIVFDRAKYLTELEAEGDR